MPENDTSSKIRSVAIIGGGITGLAAAYRAQKRAPETKVVVFDSSDRLGGVLRTEQKSGFTIEHSADMFTTDPSAAIELCRELGHEEDLLTTIPVEDRAYVATTDAIHPVPKGFSLMLPNNVEAVLQSPILSEKDKQRFLEEEMVDVRDIGKDESLLSFANRRFGPGVFMKLIQPLASGIYTADPRMLSMRATMSRFLDLEKSHGSLIGAGKRNQEKASSTETESSGARYSLFRAPKKGMGQLVDWIMDAISNVDFRTNCSAEDLSQNASGWTLSTSIVGQDGTTSVDSDLFDAVVIAAPSQTASGLIRKTNSELSDELAKITAASSAIVILGIDRSQIGTPFSGYGIIYPHVIGRKAIACSFASNKFPDRAADEKMLIRVFIGGALQSELVDLDDEKLVEIAIEELKQSVGFSGAPELTQVHRWRDCMPQYHVGHLELVDRIEALTATIPSFELAGKSYRGVGIPACIQSGYDAVDRIFSS
jgi:oxygen-dependent protoporphyrinogen oxidase